MELTSENVTEVFMDCLFTDEEAKTIDVTSNDFLKGTGVMTNVGFHIERTTKHKEDVKAMLNCLPDTFKQSGGGGMSFLNMCFDANDNQWTGFHKVVDQLVCLAVALDLGALLMVEFKDIMPGGVPYFVVKD
jgi:hypothetical protein